MKKLPLSQSTTVWERMTEPMLLTAMMVGDGPDVL
ncbi:MAG: hypothetical protein A4E30_00398 [Methanomassiliicoccales archaeon PtaB.Bin215]|nr:MAG: hypothetical protein A4E30_00398 [Methanomassiliicoccales archaeon PtaB.Bin215]